MSNIRPVKVDTGAINLKYRKGAPPHTYMLSICLVLVFAIPHLLCMGIVGKASGSLLEFDQKLHSLKTKAFRDNKTRAKALLDLTTCELKNMSNIIGSCPAFGSILSQLAKTLQDTDSSIASCFLCEADICDEATDETILEKVVEKLTNIPVDTCVTKVTSFVFKKSFRNTELQIWSENILFELFLKNHSALEIPVAFAIASTMSNQDKFLNPVKENVSIILQTRRFPLLFQAVAFKFPLEFQAWINRQDVTSVWRYLVSNFDIFSDNVWIKNETVFHKVWYLVSESKKIDLMTDDFCKIVHSSFMNYKLNLLELFFPLMNSSDLCLDWTPLIIDVPNLEMFSLSYHWLEQKIPIIRMESNGFFNFDFMQYIDWRKNNTKGFLAMIRIVKTFNPQKLSLICEYQIKKIQDILKFEEAFDVLFVVFWHVRRSLKSVIWIHLRRDFENSGHSKKKLSFLIILALWLNGKLELTNEFIKSFPSKLSFSHSKQIINEAWLRANLMDSLMKVSSGIQPIYDQSEFLISLAEFLYKTLLLRDNLPIEIIIQIGLSFDYRASFSLVQSLIISLGTSSNTTENCPYNNKNQEKNFDFPIHAFCHFFSKYNKPIY